MFNLMRNLLPNETPPTKVMYVTPALYAKRRIICRKDDLVLYAPETTRVRFRSKFVFEVILFKQGVTRAQAFSVFRSDNQADAEERFNSLKDKLLTFLEIVKDMKTNSDIQKISDVILYYPSWNIAHIAAYFALYDAFNNDIIKRYLNSTDTVTGMSPLQVALTATNNLKLARLRTINILIKLKCSLDHVDHNANSIYHLAAKENEVIATLPHVFRPRSLNNKNKLGYTPLHLACMADNLNGKTIFQNKLECVVGLLSRGAETNIKDRDGNTPLHLAVHSGNTSIIQCLIIFGADVNAVNRKEESPRHLAAKSNNSTGLYCLHAVGARRCTPNVSNCANGCKYNNNYNGDAPPRIFSSDRDLLNETLTAVTSLNRKNNLPQKGRLLCLDGGGIRGLILIQILLQLEAAIGCPINNCFDWITGTSTGGILALGLAAGKTLKECQCLYFRLKQQMFSGSRPYPSEPLETILKECLGSNSVMTDIKEPKLLIPGVLADRKPAELHLFRNYESPREILGDKHNSPYELPKPPDETLLWHVARATGAAPTYFSAFNKFLDGGLIANNPTLDALTEIHEYNLALRAKLRCSEECPAEIVVSLGTGILPVTESNIYQKLHEDSWKGPKQVLVLQPLAYLLLDQVQPTLV
ncbi:85/88 kDa calcium-independent phospholipase A2-like isoform X2 [Onthophagus taurus]|uniref:85/88 kDa calcium-independent phospholipase A2-like isoform X2 n=1 Tax=Onthophagus taurus TaxID=166361 RepID=UPI0039BE537E